LNVESGPVLGGGAVRRVAHGEIELALHELRGARVGGDGEGAPRLLLVHGLGGSSRDWLAPDARALDAWPGAILALDLAGHGDSDTRLGGAYTPELCAGDVDAALAVAGPCHLAGEGLGAYVCLLVAAARRDLVPAALLLPGPGLAGGGALPEVGRVPRADEANLDPTVTRSPGAADPLTRACALDIRPVDYAQGFAAAARALLLAANGEPGPPWWDAVRATPGVRIVASERAAAIAALAATPTGAAVTRVD
jgi:pimeloyl-ACP methyl ester carboxylesterase